jgi:2-polyprenyl-3-methyl-5-hydroxy-6-metoxy-1,4-benzoquinol methylase
MSSVYTVQVATHGLGLSMSMMIERVPRGARVLDVGCASGYLAEPLRQMRAAKVVDGIELNRDDAAIARKTCRNVVIGSAEDPATYAQLEGPYDAIIFGDVLEHLPNPSAAIRAARPLLAKGGVAISSIPNIAHYTIRASLLEGKFEYADSGILDRTHLRFFTKSTLKSLWSDNGFEVESCDPAVKMPQKVYDWFGEQMAQRIGRLRDDVFAFQYITVARPVGNVHCRSAPS